MKRNEWDAVMVHLIEGSELVFLRRVPRATAVSAVGRMNRLDGSASRHAGRYEYIARPSLVDE